MQVPAKTIERKVSEGPGVSSEVVLDPVKIVFPDGYFERFLEVLIERKLEEIRPEKPKYLDLRAACAMKGIVFNSVKSSQVQQPLIGYSCFYEGRKRYWSREQIEEWCGVFDGNRGEYIRGIIAGEDREIAEGIRAQATLLLGQETLPEKYRRILEEALS